MDGPRGLPFTERTLYYSGNVTDVHMLYRKTKDWKSGILDSSPALP